jgi:uncharacterized protein YndB with AHSA1/START domain
VTIRKSIFVKRAPDAAFRIFTAQIGAWWPLGEGVSFGGERADQLVLETRTGGRFYERYKDGEEYEVGRVLAFEPPTRVVFSWRAPTWSAATEVEVRFAPEADGTRVSLEHRGWEALDEATRARNTGYANGWDLILSRFAARAAPPQGDHP